AEDRRVREDELVVPVVVARRHGIRQGARALRVAEGEVVLLHRHDVREVGADLEPELEGDRFHALVPYDDVVLHPLADEALALDRQDVLLQPARERVAQEERGREVLDLAGREQQRPRAVDRQLQVREEARVLGEEPVRLRAADVAELVADAEGRALEDRELAHASRWTRAPEACCVALTTTSSTFTCQGRVSANMTQSAMSSATIGCTPL